MKVSDYIVEYLISKRISDVFGYPGGMVTHFMDSFYRYSSKINAHITYHEQGAAFAACGYAQASGKVGVAYATSGPGATNLITGICNAYFDSIPTLFITGQVNTFESKDNCNVRQRGFQETDIVSMVQSVTKYAAKINKPEKIKWFLDYAFHVATHERKGPVLLDIPMNVFRAEVNPNELEGYEHVKPNSVTEFPCLLNILETAQRPVFLIGNGVKISGQISKLRALVDKIKIPVVTSMVSVDVLGNRGYGFIGAYGARAANFIVAKADVVVCFGSRLDVRQVGAKRENFAPNAKIIRIDIDEGELGYKVHENELQINADVKYAIRYLDENFVPKDYSHWKDVCDVIKIELEGVDDKIPNILMKELGDKIPDDVLITTDVGQNQVWVAQSIEFKENQRVYCSGGHGAMGYSLPAAIGCALASGKNVFSFNGDGGIQMNIQELQTVVRENLPIKIIVFNNYALGMIRHFQEMYFDSIFYQTMQDTGYTVPNFQKIAEAYGIPYKLIGDLADIPNDIFSEEGPQFIEVSIQEPTYVFPKLEFGKPNQDQEPLLDRNLYNRLMEL